MRSSSLLPWSWFVFVISQARRAKVKAEKQGRCFSFGTYQCPCVRTTLRTDNSSWRNIPVSYWYTARSGPSILPVCARGHTPALIRTLSHNSSSYSPICVPSDFIDNILCIGIIEGPLLLWLYAYLGSRPGHACWMSGAITVLVTDKASNI